MAPPPSLRLRRSLVSYRPEQLVSLNGWFATLPATGSGQYTLRLAEALQRGFPDLALEAVLPLAAPVVRVERRRDHLPFQRRRYTGAMPENRLAAVGKVWFEQIAFPLASRGAWVTHVPYFAPPWYTPTPTVVTIHDVIPLLFPAYRGSRSIELYFWLVRHTARRAAAIMADSIRSQDDIVRLLGIPRNRVHVVYLAPDPGFHPQPPEVIEKVRRKYKLPPDYLLYLSGYDVRKNVPALLQAWRMVVDEINPRLPLVLGGQLPAQATALFPDIQSIVRELHLADHVFLPGWIPDMDRPALFSGATALVFPSLYEGFGLPPLEAMACGTPVASSDRGSLPEILGQAALTFDPTGPEAIAQSLRTLLTQPNLRRHLSAAGLEQAAHFTWEKTARQVVEVYRQCAS